MAEELKQTLVSETLPEAIDQPDVAPVSEPAIDADALAADAPFRYRASVEIKPEISLPELTGLPARRPVVEVGVEDVEGELQGRRECRAPRLDEPEGTAAAPGHTLVIDYAGTANDPKMPYFHGKPPTLFWLNEEKGEWVPQTGWDNPTEQTYTVLLYHFSRYAMSDGTGGWEGPARARESGGKEFVTTK